LGELKDDPEGSTFTRFQSSSPSNSAIVRVKTLEILLIENFLGYSYPSMSQQRPNPTPKYNHITPINATPVHSKQSDNHSLKQTVRIQWASQLQVKIQLISTCLNNLTNPNRQYT
jgi:hypothetical protein